MGLKMLLCPAVLSVVLGSIPPEANIEALLIINE